MKKITTVLAIVFLSIVANAQLKKDGTPDMRYKANKEMYGNSGSSYSTPSYSTPSYSTPQYEQPKPKHQILCRPV